MCLYFLIGSAVTKLKLKQKEAEGEPAAPAGPSRARRPPCHVRCKGTAPDVALPAHPLRPHRNRGEAAGAARGGLRLGLGLRRCARQQAAASLALRAHTTQPLGPWNPLSPLSAPQGPCAPSWPSSARPTGTSSSASASSRASPRSSRTRPAARRARRPQRGSNGPRSPRPAASRLA